MQKNVKRFIIKIGLIFIVLIGGLILITIALYNLNFGGRISAHRHISEHEARPTSFYSGENRLAGYIFGEENDKGLIVISHGLGGGAISYMNEIRFFVDNGWRVFAFNKTGSHSSEGSGTRGLPQSAIDLNAALSYITEQEWELPIMLYGHSWGGFAVTAVLNFDHDINAVVSLAGFAEPMQMLHEAARLMIGPAGNLTYPFIWAYQRILFGEYADLSAVRGINSVETPVKIIHGISDDVISYSGAGIIAHRERIHNPNAIFVSHILPHHSGHNNLWNSEHSGHLDYEFMNAINDFFAYNTHSSIHLDTPSFSVVSQIWSATA